MFEVPTTPIAVARSDERGAGERYNNRASLSAARPSFTPITPQTPSLPTQHHRYHPQYSLPELRRASTQSLLSSSPVYPQHLSTPITHARDRSLSTGHTSSPMMTAYASSPPTPNAFGIHGGVIVQDPNVIQYTEAGHPIILQDVFGSHPLLKSSTGSTVSRPPLRATQSYNVQPTHPSTLAWTKRSAVPAVKMTQRPRTATEPAVSINGKHEASATFAVLPTGPASAVATHAAATTPIYTTHRHSEHEATSLSARPSFSAAPLDDTTKSEHNESVRGAYTDELSFHTASYGSAPPSAVESAYTTTRTSESVESASPTFAFDPAAQAQHGVPTPLVLPPPGYPYSYPYPPPIDGYYGYPMPGQGRKIMEPILAPGELPAPRPPMSYAALIGEALLLAPSPHQLYVSEIADSVKKRYAYYRQNPSKIYNGVRHQTSMCKAFVKLPRPFGDQTGGARKWAIRAGSETWFHSGGYYPPSSAGNAPAMSHSSSSDSRNGKSRSTARSKQLAIGVPSIEKRPPPGSQVRMSGSESPGPSNGPAWDGSNRHLLPVSSSWQAQSTATPASTALPTPLEHAQPTSPAQNPGHRVPTSLSMQSGQPYPYVSSYYPVPQQAPSYLPPGYQYVPMHPPATAHVPGQHVPGAAYHHPQQAPYYVPVWSHIAAPPPPALAPSGHSRTDTSDSSFHGAVSEQDVDGDDAHGSPVSIHETE